MRILHIVLGNPKLRNGGLIKYCKDLSETQRKLGNTVYIVFPGSFIHSKKPRIVRCKKNLYKISDALPVSITYGINDVDRYIVSTESDNFELFINKIKPEIVHIHSLQGIHKEFIEVIHKKRIPIVYTTHDYFPMCCKCNLVNYLGELCDGRDYVNCSVCNRNAGLSLRKQRILQSDLYHKVKKNSIVSKISKALQKPQVESTNNEFRSYADYIQPNSTEISKLYHYFESMIENVQVIHCNSNISAEQYKKFYQKNKCEVVPITHSGIEKVKHNRIDDKILNIGYMGGMSKHKGFDVIMNTFTNMKDVEGWRLWLYGGMFDETITSDTRFNFGGFFGKDKEDEVWENIDLLIVCSQWKETFGFIVLEALARGIPVLCSDLVGSKDLVANVSDELIFKHDDIFELKTKVMNFMNFRYYQECVEKINQMNLQTDMVLHTERIMEIYGEARRMI